MKVAFDVRYLQKRKIKLVKQFNFVIHGQFRMTSNLRQNFFKDISSCDIQFNLVSVKDRLF